MATTVTIQRREKLYGFAMGGYSGLPEIDIINPVTNVVSTIKYNDKYFEFDSNAKTISGFETSLRTGLKYLSNSVWKEVRYLKTLTPENFPLKLDLEFTTDLQIVYDWTTETGEKVFTFTPIGTRKITYINISALSTALKNNSYYPAIENGATVSTSRRDFKIYLNVKQTFTTTAKQSIKCYLILSDGFEGEITIPVVKAV